MYYEIYFRRLDNYCILFEIFSRFHRCKVKYKLNQADIPCMVYKKRFILIVKSYIYYRPIFCGVIRINFVFQPKEM